MKTSYLAGAAVAVLGATVLAGCNKPEPAKPAVDTAKIAEAIKADVTERIAALNAHDAAKLASHAAADSVSIGYGRANFVGPAAIQSGLQQTFAREPDLKVTTGDQTVDVAASGDMAVVRMTTTGTYTDPKTKKPVSTTNNSVLGYKLQPDGSWKTEWTVLSPTSPVPPPPPAPPAAKA
jgi:ketosteroid isomerase-like protein